MGNDTPLNMPSWLFTLLLALGPALVALIGFYFLTNWRLTALEQRATGYELAIANTGALATMRSELNSIAARTSDAQIIDWHSWRTRKDYKDGEQDEELENHAARIDQLEGSR